MFNSIFTEKSSFNFELAPPKPKTKLFSKFRNSKSVHLTFLLLLTSGFSILLLMGRLKMVGFELSEFNNTNQMFYHRGKYTFLFMIWNLFLAWIPYGISFVIPKVFQQTTSKSLTSMLLLVWLLFFPNAPYLITDLIHLKARVGVPFWFDMMMFLSFAWTGILLGILSLLDIHQFLKENIPTVWAHILVFSFIQLSAFGIFIGRFLRWNSWDIISSPFELIEEVGYILLHPMEFVNTLGLAVVMSGFLTIGYFLVYTLNGGSVKLELE